MRRDFAAVLRSLVRGPDPVTVEPSIPLLARRPFAPLLAIVEANYPFFDGCATPEYWFDFRKALRIPDGSAEPRPRLAAKKNFLATVRTLQKRTRSGDFIRSLCELHGLGLVARRRGWDGDTLSRLLPDIVRPERWRAYQSTTPPRP